MADVTTDPDAAEDGVPTLRERMRAAGLSDERIAVHAEATAIALDGELVRDTDGRRRSPQQATVSAVPAGNRT